MRDGPPAAWVLEGGNQFFPFYYVPKCKYSVSSFQRFILSPKNTCLSRITNFIFLNTTSQKGINWDFKKIKHNHWFVTLCKAIWLKVRTFEAIASFGKVQTHSRRMSREEVSRRATHTHTQTHTLRHAIWSLAVGKFFSLFVLIVSMRIRQPPAKKTSDPE